MASASSAADSSAGRVCTRRSTSRSSSRGVALGLDGLGSRLFGGGGRRRSRPRAGRGGAGAPPLQCRRASAGSWRRDGVASLKRLNHCMNSRQARCVPRARPSTSTGGRPWRARGPPAAACSCAAPARARPRPSRPWRDRWSPAARDRGADMPRRRCACPRRLGARARASRSATARAPCGRGASGRAFAAALGAKCCEEESFDACRLLARG